MCEVCDTSLRIEAHQNCVYILNIFPFSLPSMSLHSLVKDICSAPLGVAAQNGHKEIVERLLKGGANIDYKDMVRSTLLVQVLS